MGTFKNPDVWKQNIAYQIGDFVLYNGVIYMAIKPVPAGTEMSSDYWTVFAEGAIVPTGEISITENGEVDVAQYATANVNVEGSGGGDFTTAEVIFASNTTEPFDLACPNIHPLFDVLNSNINSADMDGETPIDVVLYKSSVEVYVASEEAKANSVSGNAEIISERSVKITGNCTITFTDAEVGENA